MKPIHSYKFIYIYIHVLLLKGLFKGIAQGAVGLVVKPITGVADASSVLLKSVGDTLLEPERT